MTPKEFRLWQADVGLNGREVAEALGKSEDTITIYRNKGVPEREAVMVRLALAAISNKVAPWKTSDVNANTKTKK